MASVPCLTSSDRSSGRFRIEDTDKLNCKRGRINLGLATAIGCIQMHGGERTVTSVMGEGSTFTAWIPEEV